MSEYSTRDRSKLFKSGLVDTPDIQDAAVTVDKLAADVATYVDDLAKDSISVANTGSAGQPQLSYDSNTGVVTLSGSEIEAATKEPMGHADKTQSTISFNIVTRTFTIAPVGASFDVWNAGVRYTFTSAQSVQIPNTTGIYYICFTAGALQYKTTFFDWEADAPTAYIYWNATTGTAPFFADERHGIALDWATHEYLHRTRGAVIASGFSASNYVLGGDGTSNTHAQLDLAGGTFFDEDLQVDITHSNTPVANTWQQDLVGPAQIPVFYMSGTSWVMDTPTNFPLKMSNSLPGYNRLTGSTWDVAEVGDGKYATTWILATNNLNYPIIAIIGQSASDNSGQAEETQFSDLILSGFPVFEFRPLYKLIFKVSTVYTNSVKASLHSIWDMRTIGATAPSSFVASDHGNLSGLGDDDHLQYVHIDQARTISANHTFSGSVNFTGSVNLPNSGVTAGSYGSASQVPVITVNADGLVTSASSVNVAGVTDFDYNTTTGVIDIDTADGGNFSTTITLQPFDTADLAEGINLYYTDARVQSKLGNVSGHIIPDTNVTYDLGSATNRFRDLYLSGNSIHLDGITLTNDAGSFSVVDGSSNPLPVSLAANTTDDLVEGAANQYWTIARGESMFDMRLATKTTDNVAEGANLYYTTARANSDFDTRFTTKTTSNLAEGSNQYYTDARARNAISVDGSLLTYSTGVIGLTSETIQDVVGAMVSANSESGISVTYNDAGNVIDFAVDTGTIATVSYVNSTIQSVIDAAPAALDTLNELAAAINDDANYAATVTTALSTKVDKTTQVIAGTGMTGGGALSTNVTISHADTSSAANLTASSRTYVTALSFDGFGHVTSYSTGTETVVDTNTTYGVSVVDGADAYTEIVRLTASTGATDDVQIAVGAVDAVYGLTITQASDKITIAHANTSSQASVDNSGATVIQDITLDTYGHITGIGSKTLSYTDVGAAPTTHYHDRIYNGASGSSSYLALSSTNELEYYNSVGSIDTLYLQYSGTASQLRGPGGAQIWMDSNDGAGSGLDADLLDGQQGSYYAAASSLGNYLPLSGGTVSGFLGIGNSVGSNDGSWNARLNVGGSSHARLDVISQSDGIVTTMYSHTGQGMGKVGTMSNHPLYLMVNGGEAGYGYSGSLRSPIFYDSNDTSYYVDPNSSTSAVFAGNVDIRIQNEENPTQVIYLGANNGDSANTSNDVGTGIIFAPKYSGYSKRSAGIMQIGEGNYFKSGLAFYTNGTSDTTTDWSERVRIDMDGNVLVNQQTVTYTSMDNSPVVGSITSNKLHVSGSIQLAGNNDAIVFGRGTSTFLKDEELGFGWGGGWYMTDSDYLRVRGSKILYNNYIIRSDADMRAPIFYDQNDTSYFVDPNGRSRLSSIDYGNSGYYFAAGDWGYRHNTPYGWIQFGPANTSHAHVYTDRSNFYFNAQIQVLGGSNVNQSDIRANIFYDNQDTGYYTDPNSSSRLYQTVTNISYFGSDTNKGSAIGYGTYSTTLQKIARITFDWDANYNSENHGIFSTDSAGLYSDDMSINSFNDINLRIDSNNNDAASYVRFHMHTTGNNQFAYIGYNGSNYESFFEGITYTPDMRANIFYDRNDTGYYLDPNGTSRLNRVDPSEIYNYGWFRNHNSNQGMYNQALGTHFCSNGGASWQITGSGGNVELQFRSNHNSTVRGYVYGDTSSNFGLLDYNGSWRVRVSSGYQELYGTTYADDTRSYIYYDRNDTGYYVDANNTSSLNYLLTRGLRFHGVGGDSGVGSVYDSYAIYQQGGAWTHPYPDLCIGYHTGIKIGAYYGYNGTRFYNNSDWATIIGSFGDGDNNFRSYYNIIAYASDKRLKENITPISNALHKVLSLNGVTYDWKDCVKDLGFEPQHKHEVGVLAQDVEAVLPEAVEIAPFDYDWEKENHSKSGEKYLTVKYEKLTPLLIEAIKEQQAQIESQQRQLDEQRAMIEELKSIIGRLVE